MNDENDLSEPMDETTTQDVDVIEEPPMMEDLTATEEVESDTAEDDLSQYGAEVEEDPWDWVKELDPEKVRRTWDKFTPEWEATKRGREELARLREEFEAEIRFGKMVNEDPMLADYLSKYDPYAKQEDEDAAAYAARLAQEAVAMTREAQSRAEAERELSEVRKWAAENGMPDFDDRELIEYALQNRIPSFMTAYKDRYFEAASEAKKNKALADIKKSRGAATVTKPGGESKTQKVFTEDAIAKMTDAEFSKNLPDILSFFKR